MTSRQYENDKHDRIKAPDNRNAPIKLTEIRLSASMLQGTERAKARNLTSTTNSINVYNLLNEKRLK